MVDGVSTRDLKKSKEKGKKIVMVTAYDYPTSKIVNDTEIDIVLVGDSVGNTTLGYGDTIPVTMNEMIHHTKAVAKGCENPLLVGDMPFLSYQASKQEAIENAGRFLKEAGAQAVKVEGGEEVAEQIEGIIDAGIPVMGHLGLTPQKIHQFGGYRPHGTTADEARDILSDAKRLEKAGVFSIVLESVASELAEIITEKVEVPTIGIGAGPHCDGQVLVINDILGLGDFKPKFAKEYTDLSSEIEEALKSFHKEVESEKFPSEKHSYKMKEGELEKLKDYIE